MNLKQLIFITFTCLVTWHAPTIAATLVHEVNPDSGVESWRLSDQGVGITLMQITPDQAMAFFQGRGFDRASAAHFASQCTFMTIVRNESVPHALSYALKDWRVYPEQGPPKKLKLKDAWMKEWLRRKIPPPAQLAFEWSQLPVTQTFETGDWNQGMTTYPLAPGNRFNLEVRWSVEGVVHQTLLKNIRCADESTR